VICDKVRECRHGVSSISPRRRYAAARIASTVTIAPPFRVAARRRSSTSFP